MLAAMGGLVCEPATTRCEHRSACRERVVWSLNHTFLLTRTPPLRGKSERGDTTAHNFRFVAEYRYTGVSHRIVWHYDADLKERFDYHSAGGGAGLAGSGGSSYIDRVILRDRDHNSVWSSAADGTLEERVYLLQNWRADVRGVILPKDGGGGPQMYYRYDAFGEPIALHAGDIDDDGDVDAADFTELVTMTGFDQRGDFADGFGTAGPDGVVDFGDTLWLLGHSGTYGRGYVASQAKAFGGLRKLYAGYELDPHLAGTKYHVRNRLFDAESGRWSRRDPLGYVDGMGMYEYVVGRAVIGNDPSGLASGICTRAVPIKVDINCNYPNDPLERITRINDADWLRYQINPVTLQKTPLPGQFFRLNGGAQLVIGLGASISDTAIIIDMTALIKFNLKVQVAAVSTNPDVPLVFKTLWSNNLSTSPAKTRLNRSIRCNIKNGVWTPEVRAGNGFQKLSDSTGGKFGPLGFDVSLTNRFTTVYNVCPDLVTPQLEFEYIVSSVSASFSVGAGAIKGVPLSISGQRKIGEFTVGAWYWICVCSEGGGGESPVNGGAQF